MQVKRADVTDLAAIYSLMLTQGYPVLSAAWRSCMENLLSDPQGETVLVVTKDGKVVGLMFLKHHPSSQSNVTLLTIQDLVVHPNYSDRGIANRLLAEARVIPGR